jgi:ADP-heptose:LPS heptosyltransferase
VSVSILIIRLSSLGDIILTEPVVSELRKQHPTARIDFVTKKEYAEFVRFAIKPNTTFALDTSQGSQATASLLIELGEYTHVLDLHNTLRTITLRQKIKGKKLVVNKRSLKRWLLVKFKFNLLKDAPDVIGRYFEAARSLGVKDAGASPRIDINAANSSMTVAFAPGSKHWNKRWPLEYWIELGKDLLSRGYSIELYGSVQDRTITNQIDLGLNSSGVTDFTGKLSLMEVAEKLSACSLAVTNDSGLMHMAEAAGIRTISLFGPTVREFGFFPRSATSTVIENEGLYCRPCTAIGLDHCPEKHFRCMKELIPVRVLAHIAIDNV